MPSGSMPTALIMSTSPICIINIYQYAKTYHLSDYPLCKVKVFLGKHTPTIYSQDSEGTFKNSGHTLCGNLEME